MCGRMISAPTGQQEATNMDVGEGLAPSRNRTAINRCRRRSKNRDRAEQVPDEAAEWLNGRDSRRYLSAGVEWRWPKGLRKGDL